ncbi:MAG: hypothetical protein E6772_10330 [Dysgonomonas sp.]|nr:hypothetical protein [Dysgonomonas sp.]
MRSLILLILLVLFVGCSENKKEQNTNTQDENILKTEIEKKIGFEFPEFDAINMKYGSMGFNGDYSNTMELKFKKDIDLEPFYNEIKRRVENPKVIDYKNIDSCTTLIDEWRIDTTGEYSYYSLSDCEDGEDRHFEIRLNSKDSTVTVSYGRW